MKARVRDLVYELTPGVQTLRTPSFGWSVDAVSVAAGAAVAVAGIVRDYDGEPRSDSAGDVRLTLHDRDHGSILGTVSASIAGGVLSQEITFDAPGRFEIEIDAYELAVLWPRNRMIIEVTG